MKLISSFEDCYDAELLERAKGMNIEYLRNRDTSLNRVSELQILNRLGYSTPEIKPVSRFTSLDGFDKLVVYTDLRGHGGTGKEILSTSEAEMMYGNILATGFYKEAGTDVLKMVHIANKRFSVFMKHESLNNISKPKVVSINCIESNYETRVHYPIYSVDIIQTNKGAKAVDFNTVQNLSELGFESIMSKNEIAELVLKSIIKIK